MIPKIDHFAMIVSDLDRSKDFYGGILGFEEILRFDSKLPGINRISFMRKSEGVLELLEIEAPKEFKDDPAMPGFKHLCVEVDDFDAEYERIRKLGVEVMEEPHVLNEQHLDTACSRIDIDMKKGLKRAVFADPDGLPLEILKWL
jgi:catechol 2,3-dioxygenase-like lactoylglutathione lyase family enzyme